MVSTLSRRFGGLPLRSRPRRRSPITSLQRREIKRLTDTGRPSCPGNSPRPRTPPQQPNPRLHIPAHRKRHIGPLRQLPRDITNLVFGLLPTKTEDTKRSLCCFLLILVRDETLLLTTAAAQRGEEMLTQRVKRVRRLRGLYDIVPDDRFGVGIQRGRGVVGGGVDGVDIDEELFCVPVEEGGEIFSTPIRLTDSPKQFQSNIPASKSNRIVAYSSFLFE